MEENPDLQSANAIELFFARMASALFHPMFMPIYSCLFLVYSHPSSFADAPARQLSVSLIAIFILTAFFPVFSLLVMRGLGLIQSIQLPERKDRIIPFVAIGSFYVWTFMTFKPLSADETPGIFLNNHLLASLLLGATLSVFVAFFLNIFIKVSIHSMGCGGFLCLVLSNVYSSEINSYWFLVLAVLIAGLTGTARLILGAHSPREVYLGYFTGYISMFVALHAYSMYYGI